MNSDNKYNLINWIAGNLLCMLGIALATKSDFGLSMIAAGPYVLHVWLRETLPWFTQGTAEYFYELIVLVIACVIIREFKLKYLLTFAEAFIAGLVLDGWFSILGGNGAYESMPLRLLAFVLGLVICGFGVAFFFRTTLPLQAYDFAVVRVAEKYGLQQSRVKLANDCIMLAVSIILSLTLTKKLTGIGVGTVVTTLLNSTVIAAWGKLIDRMERRKPAAQ